MTNLYLAYTYDSGAYGAGNYETGVTANGGNSPSSSGGILTNTGFDIAVIVTLACVIALLAIVVKVWKGPSKPKSPQYLER